jgi:hypothetical protein
MPTGDTLQWQRSSTSLIDCVQVDFDKAAV